MIRILVDRMYSPELHYIEAAGLSTDTKPTANVVTGSLFAEVDTQTVLIFDEEASDWETFVSFGGES